MQVTRGSATVKVVAISREKLPNGGEMTMAVWSIVVKFDRDLQGCDQPEEGNCNGC